MIWHSLFLQYARACSVCNGNDNPIVAKTYFDITLLMSFLPMVIFAGGIFFFWYRAKQIKREQQ